LVASLLTLAVDLPPTVALVVVARAAAVVAKVVAVVVVAVDDHKMYIFTANIPIFHSIYRR
jgi:hypothetical protein